MKQISTALAAHLQQDVTTLASCWKITRRDGVILGFTDHDKDLVLDGITYIASSGYLRSAIANTATTAVDNLQVHGFLDNDMLSEDELRNGAYDYANVEIFTVNWYDLSQGILRMRYGLFGEVQIYPSGLFAVELRGLLQLLSQTIGEIYSPECRADLGDARCKIKLIPDQRLSSKSYNVGDRVVIPHDVTQVAHNIPINNGDFEIAYRGPAFWGLTNYVRNAPSSTGGIAPQGAGSGFFGNGLCEPMSRSGNISRLWLTQNGAATAHCSIYQYQIASGSTLKVSFRFSSGFGSGTEIATVEALSAAETAIGAWTQRSSGDITIPPGTTKITPIIEWNAPDGQNAQVLFDTFLLGTDIGQLSGDANDAFDNVSGLESTAFGWSGPVGFSLNGGVLNLTPISGSHYGAPLSFDARTGSVQTQFPYPLVTGSITAADIDANTYDLVVSGLIAAEESGWMGGIDVVFYDVNGNAIANKNVSIPLYTIIPRGEWKPNTATGNVPTGARSFSITLKWTTDPYNNNTRPRVGFDKISIAIQKRGLDPLDIRRFAGMEFLCTTAGVSALTQPDVSSIVVGNAVADGSVIWEAVTPQYTFLATVGTVFNNSVFTLPDLGCADNFVQFGVIKFLTGNNIGRAIEVQSWDNTSKVLSTELPMPYPPQAGDVIMVHAGCDKSRATCTLKFANIINFRGEPDIPGNDQYFHIGRNL